MVSLYKRSGKPIKDCIKQVLNARPKTITTILIQGKFLSQKLIDHLKTIVPFERNKLFNSLIKNNFPDIIFQGQKLGNKSFVIIGNDETLEYLNNIEGGYEEKIENLLLKEFGI